MHANLLKAVLRRPLVSHPDQGVPSSPPSGDILLVGPASVLVAGEPAWLPATPPIHGASRGDATGAHCEDLVNQAQHVPDSVSQASHEYYVSEAALVPNLSANHAISEKRFHEQGVSDSSSQSSSDTLATLIVARQNNPNADLQVETQRCIDAFAKEQEQQFQASADRLLANALKRYGR